MLHKAKLTPQQTWLTDLIGITLLFLVFYTLWLGSYSLFTPDEGRYSEVAREMLISGDFITPRVDGVAFLDKPVLYYWLQASAMYLFGVKEWALRLFPVLFGLLGTLVTYCCSRLLFNRHTALLSAAILATAPLYFCGAHYANLDLEVAVLISSALLCFITAIQENFAYRKSLLCLAYIFAGLACLTKGMIGIVFPAMIIGTWIIVQWRWRILTKMLLIPGLIIIFAIALPWYYLVQKANPAFLHYFFVTQQVTRFLSKAQFNNAVPFWFYVPIVLFGFFPWTIFLPSLLLNIKKIGWKNQPVKLFLVLWIALVFIFFSIPHSKAATYILPVFPPLAILVGNFLAENWKNAQQKNIKWAIANFFIIACLLAATLMSIPYYEWLDITSQFTPWLIIGGSIFIVGAFVSLFCLSRKKLLPLFSVCITASILFLLTLLSGAKYLNHESTKPLVAELKTLLQPQDEVITYNKYYQDLPLYLGQRVTIVADWNSPKIPRIDNWARELWFGMPFQKTDWLINEDAFWDKWNSDKRVFVFLGNNYLSQFSKHAKSYFQIARNNNIYLLSNKPTFE